MTETRTPTWRIALTAAVLVALMGMVIALSAAEADDDRLERKVRVMERVIDEVLVQSDHVMISAGGTTHGLVLDGFGALFVFEGSVMGGELLIVPEGFVFPGDADSVFTFESRRQRTLEEAEDEELDHLRSWKEREKEAQAKRAENLEKLEGELADALIDYGATLGELEDDEWVAIAAFLGGSRFLDRSTDTERLVLKVRMRDLRQYAASTLSREAAAARVVVER
jgi:hypothetical protein